MSSALWCFSAGDTLDEAIENAKEAVALWIETAIDSDQAIPKPSTLTALRANEREDRLRRRSA